MVCLSKRMKWPIKKKVMVTMCLHRPYAVHNYNLTQKVPTWAWRCKRSHYP